MAASAPPGRFGHIVEPDAAWLARQEKEPILEPELAIVDTHHHLWRRGGWTYLLPELLADLDTGHNIVATVFEECRSMYRADGPPEMRPVGEVEFVAGIAAMSASGGYGPIKVAQAIVGYADLALGDRVEPVLEALIRAGGGRLAGVRYSVGTDAGRQDEVHAAWRAGMAELATCPNVSVKLGGMLNRGAALDFYGLEAPRFS